MKTSPTSPSRLTRAFTLVEILVAITVMGLVVTGVIRLMSQTMRTYFYDGARARINRDIRTFTQDMDTDAAYANYFLVFPDFSTRTKNSGANDNYLVDGQSGDFLLLISVSINATTGSQYITKLVGYYRDAASNAVGPVRKFTVAVPSVDPTTLGATPMASLLDTYMPTTNQSSNPIVVQLAQALAVGTSNTEGLFYDFKDRSVMVRGQIIETGSGSATDVNRRAVNTYNFAVSPRG